MIKRPQNSKRGFIAMVALILLIIFGIMGVSYWMSSRMTTSLILNEAHRIKARNFAQAAAEKVKINLCNQYNMNNHNLNYPSEYTKDRTDKEYNREFADGQYKVLSVQPHEADNMTYYNVPHYQKGVVIGHYDIWSVKTYGQVKSTGIEAEMTTLIKIYRDYVSY
jgi:hypothetical protein